MSDNIYRELQQRLDKYSLGFPETKTGIEIKILKKLFSKDDAAMFLALTPLLEEPESIASRLERPVEEVSVQLEEMAERGLLFRLQKGDKVKYGAIPFIHGLFEFQVKRLDRDMAELVNQYHKDELEQALIDGAEAFLRIIPVGESIRVKHNVAAYEDACEILEKMDNIVVTDCICRKQKTLVDESCGKPMEACFMFGSMAQYYLDHDMGRKVNADEAMEILTAAQKAGLVTQPATAKNPGGMCNCCGDCCGILASLNSHPRPAEMVFSNHYAVSDSDACIECEECLDFCQMEALSMDDEEKITVNSDRCIGCGLCVAACPSDALKLEAKPADKMRTPPANSAEQMMAMAAKRGIEF